MLKRLQFLHLPYVPSDDFSAAAGGNHHFRIEGKLRSSNDIVILVLSDQKLVDPDGRIEALIVVNAVLEIAYQEC